MKIKEFLQQFLSSLTCFMIGFTLVMMPYPNISGNVYADDEPDNSKVYKPGEEFEDDLNKTDLTNHYTEGFVGYVEQFVGAVFALIGIILIPKPFVKAVKACPQHMGAKIAYPLITAGSISYLIGEASANTKFKEASKMAVDKAQLVTAKQDTSRDSGLDDETLKKNNDANKEQLNAFYAVRDIYEKQEKGIENKLIGAGIAEVAFIAAEVVEIKDVLTNSKTGETTATTYHTTITTAQTTATSAALPASYACPQLVSAVEAYSVGLSAADAERFAKGLEESLDKGAEAAIDAQQTMFSFLTFATLFPNPKTTHKTQVSKWNGISASNSAMSTTIKTTRTTNLTTISTAAGTCAATIASNCSAVVLPPAYAACVGAQTALVTAAVTGVSTATSTIEATKNLPVLCMGTESETTNDGDAIYALNYSNIYDTIDDNHMANIAFNDANLERNLFYVKKIISNLFYRIAWDKVEQIKNLKPTEKLKKLAATTQYVDHLVDEAMKKITDKKFLLEVEKEFKISEFKSFSDFGSLLNKLKFEMIKTAQAEDGQFWMELLMIGAKAIGAYMLFGGWLKEHAFPKPKTRIITWGAMALVNAAIIVFDTKKLKQIKQRKKVVIEEAQRFADSSALKTTIDTPDAGTEPPPASNPGGGGTPFDTGDPVIACAKPKGSGFAPAACPTKIPKSRFKVPRSLETTGIKGGLTDLSIGLVSDAAQLAATGGMLDGSGNLAATLKSINSKKKLLIAKRDKLRKKIDKREKDKSNFLKKKTGKSRKPVSLANLNSALKKHFSDPARPALNSGGTTVVANSKNNSDSKNKKSGTKVVGSIPKFGLPQKKGDVFDFNLNDEENESVRDEATSDSNDEDLANFELNENDIIERSDINIFKVISNRYLRSYPILLEENKKK